MQIIFITSSAYFFPSSHCMTNGIKNNDVDYTYVIHKSYWIAEKKWINIVIRAECATEQE